MAKNIKLTDPKWWDKSKKHEAVFSLVKLLESNGDRVQQDLIHARLYANSNIAGLDPHTYSRQSSPLSRNNDDNRIKLNVIAAVIDTLSARISKQEPKVMLLPSGADWDVQSRSKKLQKFINGAFAGAKIHEHAIRAFLDMCVFGTGCLRVVEEYGNLAVERVMPYELLVDDEESMYGEPRQMHRKKIVSRDVLKEMFPGNDSEIDDAGNINKSQRTNSNVSDNITVVESWHLKSGPDAKDGRHTITISKATLLDEEYTYDDFPFVFMRMKDPLLGFWGSGIAANLVGLQLEINKILIRIQKAFHLLSNPMVFVHTSSGISKAYINNMIGVIIPYSGPKVPEVVTHRTVNPEVTQHLDRLYDKAFEISGVSQLAATSKKPKGLDSGKAIREYDDIGSERFALISRQWEMLFIDMAYKFIERAKEMYESNSKDLEVTVKGKRFIKTIKWQDVDLDESMYAIKIDTSSSLPDSKSGRTQETTDLLKAGVITSEEWRSLMNIEDLEGNADLARAARDYIRYAVDEMLDTGIFIEPEPLDDLSFAMSHTMQVIQQAKLAGAPEERVQLLRDFVDVIKDMLAAPEPMPQPGGLPVSGPSAGLQQPTGIKQLAAAPVMPPPPGVPQ